MIALLVAGLLAFQQASVPAPTPADSILEARTKEVAATLRCPVCQGLSVQDSPARLAQEMRGVVKEQLRAGKSPKEIKAYFVSKYGEGILLEPPARGFNLLVYVLPVAVFIAGGVLVVHLARKWSRGAGGGDAPAANDMDELEPEFR